MMFGIYSLIAIPISGMLTMFFTRSILLSIVPMFIFLVIFLYNVYKMFPDEFTEAPKKSPKSKRTDGGELETFLLYKAISKK